MSVVLHCISKEKNPLLNVSHFNFYCIIDIWGWRKGEGGKGEEE
jgi:hypothetical protein